MKPTDDERREVAENLRNMCGCGCRDAEEFNELLNDTVMRAWDFHDFHDVANRLADLIEPEERTCRCGVKTIGQVFPDGFDFDGEYTTVYIFPLSCGHEVRSLTNRIPRFCPSCGAKVVSDA